MNLRIKKSSLWTGLFGIVALLSGCADSTVRDYMANFQCTKADFRHLQKLMVEDHNAEYYISWGMFDGEGGYRTASAMNDRIAKTCDEKVLAACDANISTKSTSPSNDRYIENRVTGPIEAFGVSARMSFTISSESPVYHVSVSQARMKQALQCMIDHL